MKKYIILTVLLVTTFVVLFYIREKVKKQHNPENYVFNEGAIYGSTYHLIYESPDGENLKPEIMKELQAFDSSMSVFSPTSVISRLNKNDTTVKPDYHFIKIFNRAMEVSEKTDGAFDITVAPLVNAWGFGFKNEKNVDSLLIDSLLQYVGYKKVRLINNILVKDDPHIMIDANAIAPGYAADIIADFLEKKGCKNYMIEIGGEIRVKGINKNKTKWRVGIDKPIEDPTAANREIQDIIMVSNLGLATSGNYRKFYVKEGRKYSHTINPKTGHPVRHELLSATVLAHDGTAADAYATVCMVIGLEKSMEMCENDPDLEGYFIYTDNEGKMQVKYTKGIDSLLVKE
jgi:FAD:protein FMN transferase